MELISPTRRLTYSDKMTQSFLQQLALDDSAKRIITVEDLADVLMSNEGLFAGEFQLTQGGAEQYLNFLAKGLYQTVRSLMAETHPDVDAKKLRPLVAQLVNRVLAHRIAAVRGMRAVCCRQRKQLDGFVSKSYVMISNEQVFGLFKDACDVFRGSHSFYRAELDARDMTIVMLSRDQIVTADGATGAYIGAVCQNGETAGRAIRATPIVLDAVSRSWSAAPFDKELRISHTRSRKLRDRMMAIADTLSSRQIATVSRMGKLLAAGRNAVSPKWDATTVRRFKSQLVATGESLHVHAGHIEEIMAVLPAADKRPPSARQVYTACLQQADSGALGLSMPLRQLAFQIMFG